MAAIWVSSTPGMDTAAEVRCFSGNRVFGRQRTDPLQRLEADRTHHDQLFGHRLEQQLHLTDQLGQFGFDAGPGDQLLECLQPGAALATERHRVGLARCQPIDQSVGVVRSTAVAVGREAILLVDRHL